MKTGILVALMAIAAAVSGLLYFLSADSRYAQAALDDYPAWRSAYSSDCQLKTGISDDECQCLIDKTGEWDTAQHRPPPDTSIWNHAYIQAKFYSDEWKERTLQRAIEEYIVKEVGPKNKKGEKAIAIRSRYYDEVIRAVTFNCVKGDKIYTFWDDPQLRNRTLNLANKAYLVGRNKALRDRS